MKFIKLNGINYWFLIPLLVLITGLAITFLNWDTAKATAENELRLNFEFRARDINTQIVQRLSSYKQILRGTRGLYYSTGDVSRKEFNVYIKSLNLDKNFPGIQGIGYSLIIPKNQISRVSSTIHNEGFPEYKLWPEGERETYTSIIYIEPFKDLNLNAFGYDMFSEPVRRKAMETARDSNDAIISGKVTLVQEKDKVPQAGFLIYLPVYRYMTSNITLSERRSNILGWVYSPFRMGEFMRGLFGKQAEDLVVEIYDGQIVSEETQMYNSNTISTPMGSTLLSNNVLDLNGNSWRIIVKGTGQFESRIQSTTPRMILIVGISISFLLTILTWLIVNKRMLEYETFLERERIGTILEKTNRELIKTNSEKDKFFSIIAHDLKNPFQAIIGLTELMVDKSEKISQEEFIEYSNLLNGTVHKLFSLLENLLEWAQIHRGSIIYTPEELNLSQIIIQSIEFINQSATQKNISIIYKNGNAQNIYADRKMIATVIRNLLSNAVKFTKTGGKIIVRSNLNDNNSIEVSVADNGVGIPECDVRKLFRIEEKVSSIGTEGEKSTGLGLLLCKEFIDMHGGKIWVESVVGKGSKFYFSIPITNK